MKRGTLIFMLLCVVLLGGFLFLLSASGPENAPTEVITTELPDTFEQ